MSHDVLGFGEALLRLQPEGDARLEDAARFAAHPGGAELNTCYALAALGLRTAWVSRLPDGPLGRRILRHLRGAGVDTSLVRLAPGRLGTYWVEYGREPRSIEVIYDRAGSTITEIVDEDVPWAAAADARCVFVSGITPALGMAPRRIALALATRARAGGRLVTDLNYRARLWSAQEAAPVLEQLAQGADIVIATMEDLATLFSLRGEAEAVARAARARFGCRMAVLTRGGEGALSFDGERVREARAFPCHRLDRIGAGDAFTAGYLFATLTGREDSALDHGLALAALKHTVPGDTLGTTAAELERVLARETRDIQR